MTFYGLVAAAIFLAMTALWVFGEEEPTGALLVISAILWWGSAVVLVVFGLVSISRWRRTPEPASGSSRHRASGS
jgi:hypothetical protein